MTASKVNKLRIAPGNLKRYPDSVTRRDTNKGQCQFEWKVIQTVENAHILDVIQYMMAITAM